MTATVGLMFTGKHVPRPSFTDAQVLFATETFSMGLNMPARTVVFTASRKVRHVVVTC